MKLNEVENASFSGSYSPEDVSFLLLPTSLIPTPLEERELLIASGERHYSEMIGTEDRPSRERMRLFRDCLNANGDRMARDVFLLARQLVESVNSRELVVVSLARAGTPIGVLLRRILPGIAPGIKVFHYSISVIRDRGIDLVALNWILKRHSAGSVRFVDGWTGKGTIAQEVHASISEWKERPRDLSSKLWVPLDICGAAGFAGSFEDYLIPSTLLGGTISGLVSRSILPANEIGSGLFHRCVILQGLRRFDISRWFITEMVEKTMQISEEDLGQTEKNGGESTLEGTNEFVDQMLRLNRMSDRNRIKVGISETVRVLMRRLPKVIYLSESIPEFDGQLIRRLASMRGVPITIISEMKFLAAAVIHEVVQKRPLQK